MARVGLVEDGVAARQGDGGGVVEAPDTRERPKIVVKTAVLLHQDHDVLDVVEARPRWVGDGLGRRPAQAGRQHGAGHGGAGDGRRALQQLASTDYRA